MGTRPVFFGASALLQRVKIASTTVTAAVPAVHDTHVSLGVSPRALQSLLVIAGLACCVAMSMPQVHLVAYCGDLGYGAARGAGGSDRGTAGAIDYNRHPDFSLQGPLRDCRTGNLRGWLCLDAIGVLRSAQDDNP